MTRKEMLSNAVKKFEETKDNTKKYPEPNWVDIAAFREMRRKAKEVLYFKASPRGT